MKIKILVTIPILNTKKVEFLIIHILGFTAKKKIKELLESSGFKILKVESSIKNFKGKSFAKTINSITFGVFKEFFSTQYFFRLERV